MRPRAPQFYKRAEARGWMRWRHGTPKNHRSEADTAGCRKPKRCWRTRPWQPAPRYAPGGVAFGPPLIWQPGPHTQPGKKPGADRNFRNHPRNPSSLPTLKLFLGLIRFQEIRRSKAEMRFLLPQMRAGDAAGKSGTGNSSAVRRISSRTPPHILKRTLLQCVAPEKSRPAKPPLLSTLWIPL